MHQRTHRFVARSVIVGIVLSVLFLSAAAPGADACSFVGPVAFVDPAADLVPGQQLSIKGTNYIDLKIVPVEWPEVDGVPVPGNSCEGIVVEPQREIAIVWRGANVNEVLTTASGPEFSVQAVVPAGASPGPAVIDVGGVPVQVSVGDPVPPPPCAVFGVGAVLPPECPCPLAGGADAAVLWCPPPPCAVFGVGSVLPPECPCPLAGAGDALPVWCPPPPPPPPPQPPLPPPPPCARKICRPWWSDYVPPRVRAAFGLGVSIISLNLGR
jgi:hypothetical protein